MRRTKLKLGLCPAALLLALSPTAVWADGGVTYTNIASGGGAGIDYERVPSDRNALERAILEGPSLPRADFFALRIGPAPLKPRGAPGVALLDYDGDGDLDIYATNGPGADNSLYANQFADSGSVSFVDNATAAGVALTAQDNTGVCFGDIDNDGDADLYVLAYGTDNVLFENQGDGTFTDISASSGTGAGNLHPTSCAMADFDGDGLLDIVIANSYDGWEKRDPFAPGPGYLGFEHNQLFLNNGANVFTNASASSGLENVYNGNVPGSTGASHSWALAAYDHDQDGDIDILFADNQFTPALDPSQRRGFLRFYENDGHANFVDITPTSGLDQDVGGWMGLGIGDVNCDGGLDFFATDTGYTGGAPSTYFLRQADGTYEQADISHLAMTPFGWGVSMLDYDNDADADFIYHGGVDTFANVVADNPGALMVNTGECSGVLDYDATALLQNHVTRLVEGVAVGDLNADGFEDIVTVSAFNVQPFLFFPFVGFLVPPTGSPFDPLARVEFTYNTFSDPVPYIGRRDGAGVPLPNPNGDMTVEINSADNGNGWVEITTVGSAGYLNNGTVNRDGIGAVVSFTPDGGKTSTQPILGGSSYQSQDSLAANFGLGTSPQGTVEILWPGGIRNRLYDVANGERLVMPHIPCSFDGVWQNFGKYNSCVMQALNTYKNAGLISSGERNRLRDSARRAFQEQ